MSKLVQGKWGFFNRGFIELRARDNKELSANYYNEPNISLLLLQLCREYVGVFFKGVSPD